MKIEGEAESTIQSAYDGTSSMTHNKEVNAVLLQDGWHSVIPGSFKLFKTEAKVPFVRFDLETAPVARYEHDRVIAKHTVEIFPQGLHGVAYPSEPHSPSTGNEEFKAEEFK